MVFGMFMAILDIQIVSASLSQIQAGLSASQDEVAWVQTSYLIAEVIMIPLSGFLSRAFSTRYIFVLSAAGFTLMSLMCSTATTINEMIVWRALQGFIGGGMIPTVFASAFTIFPRSKQPIIGPIIGLVATLAPTIGPTVGGYLTDVFSWHWLFLVNIPPGIMVTLAAWFLIDFDKPDFSLLPRFDWTGLIAMAGFLGALEYALEEGPSKNWFDDGPVTIAVIVSASSAIVFFWRAFNAPQPIVDLTCYRDRNFWTGSVFSFVMGIGLYGLTYVYPVYLATVRGFTPLMIGQTMFVTGVCMFVMAPISGRLMTKVDPRLMIATGFVGFAIGTWLASDITADWDFWELLGPADVSRLLADAVHGAHQQSRARHDGAAEDEERLGPLQSHAQRRRRVRPRADHHRARQAHGPASSAAARVRDLGPQCRGRDAVEDDGRHGRAGFRRGDGRDQADGADGAPSGRGDGAERRLRHAHRGLPRHGRARPCSCGARRWRAAAGAATKAGGA